MLESLHKASVFMITKNIATKEISKIFDNKGRNLDHLYLVYQKAKH
jgi:hypothetical protein